MNCKRQTELTISLAAGLALHPIGQLPVFSRHCFQRAPGFLGGGKHRLLSAQELERAIRAILRVMHVRTLSRGSAAGNSHVLTAPRCPQAGSLRKNTDELIE
jgi:hypothetical protein